MAAKVELLKKLELYRTSHPDLKRLPDEQIISIMVEEKVITLSEAQKLSVFAVQSGSREGEVNFGNTKTRTITLPSGRKIVIKDGISKYYAADGAELKKEYFEKQEGVIDVRPSGRYSVTKSGKTKYYAADGAVGGAVDNAFRTAYDGGGAEEALQAGVEGFVGGAIMSPVIGGGMKAAGKLG